MKSRSFHRKRTCRKTCSYLLYAIQQKKLVNVVIKHNKATVVKKDAHGISVTEVFHILRLVTKAHRITVADIKTAEKLLDSF